MVIRMIVEDTDPSSTSPMSRRTSVIVRRKTPVAATKISPVASSVKLVISEHSTAPEK